ncbi:MAG: TonB-dependent receptor, partial [Odoribacter sp.]|nr:TonB-dependent receptor [Odoribacter sp.]
MKGSERNSYGFGTKFIYDRKNLRVSNDLQVTMVNSENSPYGNFSTYTSILPYHREKDEDGKYYSSLSLNNARPNGMTINNAYNQKSPIYEAKYLNSYTGSEIVSVTDNIGINWNITNELKVRGNFSLGYDYTRTDAYLSPLSYDSTTEEDVVTSDALFQRGKYELGNERKLTYSGNAIISYFKTFGKHDLQAIVGGELKEVQSNSDAFIVTGFLNDVLGYPAYGSQYLMYGRPLGSEDMTRNMGVFSNINYSYDSRYLFDLTGRIDGSSLYGRNQMYYKYWSTGFRWNLHRESFLAGFENIDLLALRLNIGTTGNQNFQRNQAMSLYTYLNNPYGNFFGASVSVLGNPDLQGQLTLNRNIGFE